MSYMSLHHALYITLGLLYNLRLPSCARTAVVLKVRWLVPTRLLLSYFIFKTERTEGSFILRQESPTILALFPQKKQMKRLGTSRELKRAWFDTEGEKIDDRKNGGKMSKGVRIERWDIFKLSAYSCLLLTNWLM